MWTYVQRTGNLYRNGALMAQGYSGYLEGRNNPTIEAVANVGPIPVDTYRIGRAFTHRDAGPVTLRLTPLDGKAGGAGVNRAGFLIHGDNRTGDASRGCIILPRVMRTRIDMAVAAGDDQLEVIAEERMRA